MRFLPQILTELHQIWYVGQGWQAESSQSISSTCFTINFIILQLSNLENEVFPPKRLKRLGVGGRGSYALLFNLDYS